MENYFRIQSKANGEYLYAGSDDLAKDADRRRVFTWDSTNPDLTIWGFERDWKITPFNKGFFIQNRYSANAIKILYIQNKYSANAIKILYIIYKRF